MKAKHHFQQLERRKTQEDETMEEKRTRLAKEKAKRIARRTRRETAREEVTATKKTPWYHERREVNNHINWWWKPDVVEDGMDKHHDDFDRGMHVKSIDSTARSDEIEPKKELVYKKFDSRDDQRAKEKKRRDAELQELLDNEAKRWSEELIIADDNVPERVAESAMNKEIHQNSCMPTIQYPGRKREPRCRDCEDDRESGEFWDEVLQLRI